MSSTEPRTLTVLPGPFSVCRLGADAEIPPWAEEPTPFTSITRTSDELSVLCPQEHVPPGVDAAGAWRCLRLEGPFGLTETGVLASVVAPLAGAGVSTFAVATHDTDYLLVDRLEAAVAALEGAGHRVARASETTEARAR